MVRRRVEPDVAGNHPHHGGGENGRGRRPNEWRSSVGPMSLMVADDDASVGRLLPGRSDRELPMFYYVLRGDLERDVRHYARRRCVPGEYALYRDRQGNVVVGFHDEDRATLFLNLFDDEIERSFEATAKQTAAA